MAQVFPETILLLDQLFKQGAVTRSEQVARSSLVEESLQHGSLRTNSKLTLLIVDDCDIKTAGGDLVKKIRGRLGIQVRGIELHNEHQRRIAFDKTPHSRQRQRFSSFDIDLDQSRLKGVVGKKIIQFDGAHRDGAGRCAI